MKKIIPLVFLISFFLLLKIDNNSARLSDTNIYFNIAYQIFNGKLLYKDIFFLNFPIFSYVSFFYYIISGKNIDLFYLTSVFEVSIITILIYVITFNKTKDILLSFTSSSLYILSFIVLSTSDHQTGVFTASLFAVLSYFFFQKEKIFLSGVFMALSFLTKAYFIPILLSLYLYILLKKQWKNLSKFTIGLIITTTAILLPFLILAPTQFFYDIFNFSLTRPISLSKTNIMWFFITKDFILFILLIFNILNIKRNQLFAFISIFSIFFFVGFQDIFYLYLNFLIPFLCISLYEMYYFLKEKLNLQKFVIPTIIFIFLIYNLLVYVYGYRNLGKIYNINAIANKINQEKPRYLYGVNDITPGLLSITHVPALENVNDAHEYYFIRKIYNKKFLTDKAVKNKTIIITHGADYPQYGIKQDILDNIFVKETIYKSCKNILSVPVLSEGDANRINLFKCY